MACVQGEKDVAVAVRSGSLLATAFHPELTEDLRWSVVMPLKRFCSASLFRHDRLHSQLLSYRHQMFVDMVRKQLQESAAVDGQRSRRKEGGTEANGFHRVYTPPDLPIYS